MLSDQPQCSTCIICRDYDDLDDIDRRVVGDVQKHGWSVIGIEADENGPGWAFTVGLWHAHGSPELAMFGLDVNVMRPCLDTIAEQIVAGRRVSPDEELDDVIKNYPVVLKEIVEDWYPAFFGTAIAFYRRPPLPMLEVVWPDKAGRFPWHADSEARYRPAQPNLWLHPSEHPAGVWTQDV